MTPQEEALARQATEDRGRLVQQALLPTLTALRAGNLKEAQRLELERLRPLAATAEQGLGALIRLRLDGAREAYAAATASAALVRRTALAAMAGGLLFALLFGMHLSRSIGRQLGAEPQDAARLAQSVAAGDLATRIEPARGDGSSLMARLQEMQASLAKVVTAVRQNADSVATASAQIAAGQQRPVPAHRSSRPVGAGRNRRVDGAAQRHRAGRTPTTRGRPTSWRWAPAAVAVKGGEVVGQVVHTMKGINDSSQDDRRHHRRHRRHRVPDQHPGAERRGGSGARRRAGPRLRGGGRRSAQPGAAQRRCGQGDQGPDRRQRRARRRRARTLVDQAGTTMTEIVTAIKRVTDIMGEISAASTEQSAGVAQVGEAVSQMDQATQQNAALVEQSAAAAESLKAAGPAAGADRGGVQAGPGRGSARGRRARLSAGRTARSAACHQRHAAGLQGQARGRAAATPGRKLGQSPKRRAPAPTTGRASRRRRAAPRLGRYTRRHSADLSGLRALYQMQLKRGTR